jgi:hypothetical protein
MCSLAVLIAYFFRFFLVRAFLAGFLVGFFFASCFLRSAACFLT